MIRQTLDRKYIRVFFHLLRCKLLSGNEKRGRAMTTTRLVVTLVILCNRLRNGNLGTAFSVPSPKPGLREFFV